MLPSSIHETLILPKSENMSFQRLQDMVQDVNAMCVSEEEVLSDGVYQYEPKAIPSVGVTGNRSLPTSRHKE